MLMKVHSSGESRSDPQVSHVGWSDPTPIDLVDTPSVCEEQVTVITSLTMQKMNGLKYEYSINGGSSWSSIFGEDGRF